MSGNNDPTVMALCGDRKVSTVKEVPTDPAFWVRELLIAGQGGARFYGRPNPQGLVFPAPHAADSSPGQLPDGRPLTPQPPPPHHAPPCAETPPPPARPPPR